MTVKKTKFGFCDNPKCKKKLIVPSWKFCEDCDFARFKKVYIKREIASIKKNIFRETRKPKEEKYKNASVVMVDENGKVIGYKL
jgi:hypothetical protein